MVQAAGRPAGAPKSLERVPLDPVGRGRPLPAARAGRKDGLLGAATDLPDLALLGRSLGPCHTPQAIRDPSCIPSKGWGTPGRRRVPEVESSHLQSEDAKITLILERFQHLPEPYVFYWATKC